MQNSILIQQKHDRIRLRKSKRDINSPEQKDLNLKNIYRLYIESQNFYEESL